MRGSRVRGCAGVGFCVARHAVTLAFSSARAAMALAVMVRPPQRAARTVAEEVQQQTEHPTEEKKDVL
jgi:hypothetical protein